MTLAFKPDSTLKDSVAEILNYATTTTSEHKQLHLHIAEISTPLGPMIAIGDDQHLHLLQFSNARSIQKEIKTLKITATITAGVSRTIQMITAELELYFTGKLKTFKTPVQLAGSEFQQQAWLALMQIPYGKTRSYLHQAQTIGNAKAFRAVANANGRNQLGIIIPCHRIINHNGDLGGYDGGIERKKWLLPHEKKYA